MKEHGWNENMTIVNIGNKYYESVLARRLEASRYRQEGVTMKDFHKLRSVASETKREVNFLTTLAYETSHLRPPFRLVVDALDFFLESYGPIDVLSTLRTIKMHTQRAGGLALLAMLTGVHDPRVQSGVEEIADCIFELERVREGAAFKHFLVIRKVRNHPEKTGVHPLAVTKAGLQIE
jgi:KaiC/GvpD/RAD55 family RecA-like ATPase